jgi:hypothetical protein
MRALKALVIGMGVLIAAGLVVVVYAVVERASAPRDSAPVAAVEGTGPEAARASVEDARIALPWGAEIAETRLAGDRVLLRLRLADGSETVEIFEAATGRRLQRLTIDRTR